MGLDPKVGKYVEVHQKNGTRGKGYYHFDDTLHGGADMLCDRLVLLLTGNNCTRFAIKIKTEIGGDIVKITFTIESLLTKILLNLILFIG